MTSDCSQCGTANEAGRNFCKECGARLARVCGLCGAENAADSKFCGQCGERLQAPAPVVAAEGADAAPEDAAEHGPVTERRLVSVLFVDLVGFTGFAGDRDAEDVRQVLDRYFATASEVVQRHGGLVEKFIGDAVMAVWGTPTAHEDDAERAVRAALEVVAQVAALGRELDLPIHARGGVLTGEAAATVGAVDQGMVTGDLVNTASRLQSAAEPGTVVVGERTYRAASRGIAFDPIDPLVLKGKPDPVPAWRAVRVVGEVGGFGRGAAPEPPFVGRDEELRLVKELLHATGREGRPRLIAVSGVAGIGKSRLIWELQKYVDGLTETVYWHQGRCPSYGDGVTFWALAEMVRGRARIADSDDPPTARGKLADTLEALVPDVDERRWLEPRLGHLLGLAGPPAGDREELFGAWRRFVERVADHGPTVLVFEDLHWADPGLMDFVESLLEWSRTSPILVLTLARPELAERRANWGAGLRSSTAVHLDRLLDADVRTLVTGYVEGLPEDGLARLVSRAEGVPLYAVETVRMLADRGILEQTGEAYRVAGDLSGEIDMPETLHALVAARLDGLPDEDRRLLQDAAVLGHTFTITALAAVTGRAHDELEPRLRGLARKELLVQDLDPRSPERGQYGFVQAVIQEVAYSTLAKAARRAKHVATARYFEALGEDELAGVVASHYLDAYRSEPGAADAESLADSAREWLARAADRAVSLGSHAQGLAYAEQALTLTTDVGERGRLFDRAAIAAFSVGESDRGVELRTQAVAAYRASGDIDRLGRFLAATTRGQLYAGRMAQAAEDLAACEEALRGQATATHALVLSAMADCAAAEGRNAQALSWSEESLGIAEAAQDDEALRAAVVSRSWALMNAGRHWEGTLLTRGGLDLARRSGSAVEEARATMNQGILLGEEDPRASLDAFLETAATAARAGLRVMQAMALANAAEAAADIGEWDVATSALHDAVEIHSVTTAARPEITDLTKAMLAGMRGDHATAAALVESLLARAETWPGVQMIQLRTWFLRVRSLVAYCAGDAEASCVDALEAVALEPSGANAPAAAWAGSLAAIQLRDPDRVDRFLDQTQALRGRWIETVRASARAAVRALRGDPHAATDEFGAALDEWLTMALPLDHAHTATAAACVLPRDLVPADHLDRASAFLTQIGAHGLLERLDVALGSTPAA